MAALCRIFMHSLVVVTGETVVELGTHGNPALVMGTSQSRSREGKLILFTTTLVILIEPRAYHLPGTTSAASPLLLFAFMTFAAFCSLFMGSFQSSRECCFRP
jgi:hypothetical protein